MTDAALAPKKLTAKQQRFVDEYIHLRFNATKAAVAAGYSAKTAYSIGSENLKKPEIRAAIDAHLDAGAMGPKEVLFRLTEHARGDMGDLWDETLGGINWTSVREQGLTHLIKKVKRKTTYRTIGDETIETVEEDVELYDAQHAQELLGKAHGLFVDRSETTLKGEVEFKKGYKKVSPDDWDE
jgi:phage terminase small subunit